MFNLWTLRWNQTQPVLNELLWRDTSQQKSLSNVGSVCVCVCGVTTLQGVELKIDFICIFVKSQCAFTWVLIRHTDLFLLFSCWHLMLWIKSVVNCCKLSILFLFFNLSDQNEEADCWQEVQKGSFMEVHLGPDPPCGGRDPGLCKLCKCSCKRYCALSDRDFILMVNFGKNTFENEIIFSII